MRTTAKSAIGPLGPRAAAERAAHCVAGRLRRASRPGGAVRARGQGRQTPLHKALEVEVRIASAEAGNAFTQELAQPVAPVLLWLQIEQLGWIRFGHLHDFSFRDAVRNESPVECEQSVGMQRIGRLSEIARYDD
jgi:hypothetical protein